MSCQSLGAARAFASDKDLAPCGLRRSVRFSSESRGSRVEERCETATMSLSAFTGPSSAQASVMSQSAPCPSVFDSDDVSPPAPSCRFPKLEECAHFHYERVSLGGLALEVVDSHDCEAHGGDDTEMEGWITLKVRSHVGAATSVGASTRESGETEWRVTRSAQHFMQLDDMLHRCIYDRKVSGLPNLSEQITAALLSDAESYRSLIQDYAHHLSMIADDSLNCGPALNWLQCDNRGHKLLVANEDSSSINTPAVAAAYSVRKYVSQARDEISFEVGDMISIIDMPGPNESVWWRGKRGFRVGLFPRHCVAVIGDKVPRHMTQPPPIVGSVAVAPIKPVLRKHGKLISLFRSFILSRPSRRSLKQQGILRERVFGCDLGEHLLNTRQEVPWVLVSCASIIESRGAVDGIYRLSGGAGLTQRLRADFDDQGDQDLSSDRCSQRNAELQRDPHALASLLKMYFRELPNPLCTYQLYESFVAAVQSGPDEATRLARMRETVVKLPPPHYRTLAYLMRHLRRVSLHHAATGMTARNMAIVWAPNLLRSPHAQHALQGVAVQAVVTEFLICYAEELFSQEQGADSVQPVQSCVVERDLEVELRRESGRRPRSLPLHAPAKLLSLEEARRRGRGPPSIALPPPSGAIAAAASAPPGPPVPPGETLRPAAHAPKYIEVGSGPNNLPQYHTVLDLPANGKRGLKRSPSGWRGLFSRSKQQRQRVPPTITHSPPPQDSPMPGGLRPVKSCESLQSDTDTVPPLISRPAPLKHHTRSASCDSYFEPWQSELADMRLRLSPQERDIHMFSEEDDTHLAGNNIQANSIGSSPAASELCSVEPSPHKNLRVDIHAAAEYADRKRNVIEEQLSQIVFIDAGDSPRSKPPEKRHSDDRRGSPPPDELAKRLCKDRDSPKASITDFQTSLANVKLRERGSPRKSKSRHSGFHQPLSLDEKTLNRLSWPNKDNTTLIKIDWPDSDLNLNSNLNSNVNTPATPNYDPLESDSENSESNKHTIKVSHKTCQNCVEEKCLKCELKGTDFDYKNEGKNHEDVTFGYENDRNDHKDVTFGYENDRNDHKDVTFGCETDKKNGFETELHAYGYENVKSPTEFDRGASKSYENLTEVRKLTDFDSDEQSGYEKVTRYDSVTDFKIGEAVTDKDLTIKSDISYQNLNRLSNSSTEMARHYLLDPMTSSHESSSSYSNLSPKNDDLYECYSFPRPTYLNLNSSSSKSSPNSPTKSPLKSTISITFRSPTKSVKDFDRDSIYEDINIDKQLSIVEEATIPNRDANLPLQEAAQPEMQKSVGLQNSLELQNSLDLQSSLELQNSVEIQNLDTEPLQDNYSQVKFFKKSIDEVNALLHENDRHYENVPFPTIREKKSNDYENVPLNVGSLKICDGKDNGNIRNLNVRELAIRFESPTEPKGQFVFEKFKTEVKYPTLEKEKSPDIAKSSKSLDENAFSMDFCDAKTDLNLNTEEITPTTENKICLIQRFDTKDTEQLSRERIEKYKEERRNFLREKYSSQSFRSNPENLTRIKIKKDINIEEEKAGELPKFERRNTVDLGQRMRFSLAKSASDLDDFESPTEALELAKNERAREEGSSTTSRSERKEKVSPSYNIRDMAAIFEQKTQNTN